MKFPKLWKKCEDLYKRIHQVHKKCQISLVTKITDIPSKDKHMVHLQDILEEDIQYIHKIEVFNEEYFTLGLGRLLSTLTF